MVGRAYAQANMGTAFTYQGFLENAMGPVTDTCDFRFGLWDAPAGGNQKGNSPQTATLVGVENGVFTTPIDFGPGAGDGTARWLEIEVQCPGDGGFTMLTPRVELTPSPYSIRAGEGVGGLNALDVTPSGNVGIGTTSPAARLDVNGAARTTTLEITGGSPVVPPLVAWGRNDLGQTDVPAGTFIAVAAGGGHGLAIRSDGTLVGWGNNDYGQTDVPGGTFIAVAAGDAYGLAIRSDGTLAVWGINNFGQTNVPSGTFTAVGAGWYHDLAIRSEVPPIDQALRLHADSAFKPGTNTWTIFSGRRLKKNIEPLSGALDRLLQLRGVTFQWLDPASQGGITGTQMGLIADEVSRAFPQWVGRDLQGYQTLTVGGFEALTAEALRELRAEKDCEIEDLKSEISDLKEMVKALTAQQSGGGR